MRGYGHESQSKIFRIAHILQSVRDPSSAIALTHRTRKVGFAASAFRILASLAGITKNLHSQIFLFPAEMRGFEPPVV